MQKKKKKKKPFHDKIASKLTSGELSSKDWWTVLKTFISPQSKKSIPPLENDGSISSDENEKANILNNFFQSQNSLNNQYPIFPQILPTAVTNELNNIEFFRTEVETILKSLTIGKASGPNNLSNRILRELAHEIFLHFVTCLISLSTWVLYHLLIKKLMSAQYIKKVIDLYLLITDLYHYLTQKVNFSKDLCSIIYTIICATIICYLLFSLVLYQETQQ